MEKSELTINDSTKVTLMWTDYKYASNSGEYSKNTSLHMESTVDEHSNKESQT